MLLCRAEVPSVTDSVIDSRQWRAELHEAAEAMDRQHLQIGLAPVIQLPTRHVTLLCRTRRARPSMNATDPRFADEFRRP
jgi:hypothetical protein